MTSTTTVTIAGIQFTTAAAEFIDEIGFDAGDVAEDLDDLRDGTRTRDGLLSVCMHRFARPCAASSTLAAVMQGADDDRLQGATDYVNALAAAVL